ncbi:MAG: DUF1553 domain-containing protein, partial [Chlorobia bacterium]|nr:DUF1553 domain-containing protein [Fimbriimonadaceae bacterium]
FVTFDATSRESCSVRRGRTNTPLQALNLLNDPAFLEAARGLARRVSDGKSPQPHNSALSANNRPTPNSSDRGIAESRIPKSQIELAFRLCTGRHAKPAEIQRLQTLYSSLLSRYQQKPEESKKLAPTPENAAMVMVASVILNLDETINKE